MQTKLQVESVLNQMTLKELKEQTLNVKKGHRLAQRCLTKIHLTQSWKVAGYKNFKAFAEKRIANINYDKLVYDATAGKVAFSIGGWDMVGIYSGASMHAMKKFNPEQRMKLWRYLESVAPNQKVKPSWLTRTKIEESAEQIFDAEDKPSYEKELWHEQKNALMEKIKQYKGKGSFAKHVIAAYSDIFKAKTLAKAASYLNKRAVENTGGCHE